VGETAGPDLLGQCGGPPARRAYGSERAKLPIDKLLKRPAREHRPPAHRAYTPEGTEEKPILFKEI